MYHRSFLSSFFDCRLGFAIAVCLFGKFKDIKNAFRFSMTTPLHVLDGKLQATSRQARSKVQKKIIIHR